MDNSLEKKVKKKKGFWDKVWKKNKLKKPDTVAVLYLKENKNVEPMEVITRRGFFEIHGKTYHERRDCIYTLVGKERTPLAIIPEWHTTPLGTKEWDDKEIQEKCAICQDHLMQGVRHAERVRMGEKMGDMQINSKTIIVGGIVLIIVLAFLSSYI